MTIPPETPPAFGIDEPVPGPPTPEVSIGGGAALTLITRVVSLGTSFLVGVIVARTFGPEGKGALSVILQVPGLLAILLDLGIGTALVCFVSNRDVSPGTALGNSLAAAAVLGVLGAPVVWMLLSGPLAVIPGVALWTTVLAIGILPLALLSGWVSSVCVGLGDLRLPLYFSIVSSVTTLAGFAALIATGHAGITGIIAVSVMGTVAGLVLFAVGLRRRTGRLGVDGGAMRRMAGFSAKAYLVNIAGLLHERQDVLLLGWLAGTAAVGLYSVGVSFAELTWYVPSALSSAILAKGSRRSELSAVDYTTRTSRTALVFMLATIVVSLAAVPIVIPVLYGTAFAGAMFAFFALLPGIIADGVTRILWSHQLLRGRLYWQQAVGTMVLNVVAVLVLASRFGAVGAALASSASYSVLAVLVVRRFCADTGATLSDVLVPKRADLHIIWRTAKRVVLRRPA